ncbi:MAG: HIT domain-containing protein [Phycisphaerales bacterium]|nr:HIT domain-containing protein [Phycisphaerales bacterium]MCB9854249.1 HIT domain-containing protein [Phycisphaerales bacterium]MCB9864743.1 HIT domain-containing protein [Phycisphaerales bacterium]
MNEFRDNIWAPWRMDYIASLDDSGQQPACFLCHYRDHPDDNAQHVVYRGELSLILMNRFPYTNGHLLIAPLAHKADITDLSDVETTDLWNRTRDAKMLLDHVLGSHGYNIGVNLGRCAGAGLPGHIHVHIVPRWNGDTNFMSVLGDVRVIPQSLGQLHAALVAGWRALGLPHSTSS